MKIRNGFVSNSSSSSFILSCIEGTRTVRDVATIMLNTIINDNEFRTKQEQKSWIKLIKNWIKNLKKVDENYPVIFPSINYDTKIAKIGDNIFISTCNNTNWILPNKVSFNSITDKTRDKLKEIVGENIDFYDVDNYFEKFYSLEFDIVGREMIHDWNDPNYSYENYLCKKQRDGKVCNCHLWETKLGIKCPICDKTIFERKEKLEKLNNLK